MCIIIDANCAAKLSAGAPEASAIVRWISKPDGHIAIGGTKLSREYSKVRKLIDLLTNLARVGKVISFSAAVVDGEASRISKYHDLKSDDEHILGLASISGARVLYSNDQALHDDFTNPIILNSKGRIYQNNSHQNLLLTAPACK